MYLEVEFAEMGNILLMDSGAYYKLLKKILIGLVKNGNESNPAFSIDIIHIRMSLKGLYNFAKHPMIF